jgi:hypothetical protein
MAFFTETKKGVGMSPFEPKRKFRWLINFSNAGTQSEFMCVSAAKPAASMEVHKHEFMNHEFKFPTKLKWQPITVKFIDSFSADMGSNFYNIMKSSGYLAPTDFNSSLMGFTKSQMQHAIGQVTIKQFDGGSVDVEPSELSNLAPDSFDNAFEQGSVQETWTLHNSLLTSIKFGDGLSYTDNGIVEVEVGLEYDYATILLGG